MCLEGVFVAGVTRTATRTARAGVDVATGEVLTGSVLVERVGWLAALIAELGQRVVDEHWNPADIRAVRAKETPLGLADAGVRVQGRRVPVGLVETPRWRVRRLPSRVDGVLAELISRFRAAVVCPAEAVTGPA
jgi:hypothetical protein